jgi:hypothetical protein
MKLKVTGMDNLWLPFERDSADRSANSSQIAVYITVSDVFPEVASDLETLKALLKELSRTDALIWCARLNLIISNSANHDEHGKQAYGIWNFFTREEAQRIQRFYSQQKGPPYVFFRGQLLELMRWISLCCNDLPGDGTTFNDPDSRRTFAKAALIASELWGQRNFQDWYDHGEIAPADRNRMLRSVRIAYEATNRGFDPIFAVGRGWSLFVDHLVRYSPSFPEDFRQVAGMALEDYFGLMFIFTTQYLNRTPEQAAKAADKSGLFLINSFSQVTPELTALSAIYLNTASQTPDELCQSLGKIGGASGDHPLPNWSDFNAIRDRPILRTTDGRAIILDPGFFT